LSDPFADELMKCSRGKWTDVLSDGPQIERCRAALWSQTREVFSSGLTEDAAEEDEVAGGQHDRDDEQRTAGRTIERVDWQSHPDSAGDDDEKREGHHGGIDDRGSDEAPVRQRRCPRRRLDDLRCRRRCGRGHSESVQPSHG
jgi:hypothetical protein